ncbi:MAG: hypothetical protein HY901_26645 [Deltaproteobacteria bacterium]|nr:hypothetical protein [Deltaproteobacteria bacterium]
MPTATTERLLLASLTLLALGACPGVEAPVAADAAVLAPPDAGETQSDASGEVAPDASEEPPDASASGPDARALLGPMGAEATDELCSNKEDDDGNGLVDCEDLWCRDSVAVAVCHTLENTNELCRDGTDSRESAPSFRDGTGVDSRVDCDDPDCGKNPYVDVCPSPRWEATDAECANGVDDDDDGLIDCADLDCLHGGLTACPLGERKRVLFDDSHRERAEMADWVIDVPFRHPFPSLPTDESQWAGLLSSFGLELIRTGRFVVETLPASGPRLRYGSSDPQDLSRYQVLVLPEPNSTLRPDEMDAVVAFVKAGGGLLMVADHYQSDRDYDGADSVITFNELLRRAGGGTLAGNPFGFSVRLTGYNESGRIDGLNGSVASTLPAEAASHPVLDGPHGKVERLGMFRGGLFTVQSGATNVAVLMHALPLTTTGYTAGSPFVLASTVGKGRVVAVGDSAILNDGTDSHGVAYLPYAAWRSRTEQNATMFLNAVEWLAALPEDG